MVASKKVPRSDNENENIVQKGTGTSRQPARLCDFIRLRHDVIIESWLAEVHNLSPARALSRPVLLDRLPEVLERIAMVVESALFGGPATLADAPRAHAMDRLKRGFELDDVVKEYSVLRRSILKHWEREVALSIDVSELRKLDDALDQLMTEATIRYARARERVLRALDRVSEAALGSEDLDAFLAALLGATLESTEAVDAAAVFLREGDRLRLRASVGHDEQLAGPADVPIDERLAADQAAQATHMAGIDPLVLSRALRARGIKALHGLPLLHGARTIGVALIGSTSAHEFSEEDKLLFRTMAHRATAVIVQAQLVADRRATETALRESEERFRTLADNIPQLAWMADETGQVFWFNRRWYEYTGTTPEEMATGGWQKIAHPDHRDRVVDRIRTHFAKGEQWEDTFPMLGKDGRYRWFLSRAVPLRDDHGGLTRWFGTNTDVTEERFLMESALRLARWVGPRQTFTEIARLAIGALADGFAFGELTASGSIALVAVETTDGARTALIHELWQGFPPDLSSPWGIGRALRKGESVLYEHICDEFLRQMATGPKLELLRRLGVHSALIVPMLAHGRAVGMLVAARWGTHFAHRDLCLFEELAARAVLALENARLLQESQETARAREEVLAVVSHELRGPLSVISMRADQLLSTQGADLGRQAHAIKRVSGRMDRLIGDLLDTASIHAGRLAIEASPVSAQALVVEALESAESAAAEKKIDLRSDFRAAGCRVLCDSGRVQQAFANLLGNAIKFCQRGDRITLGAEPMDDSVHFTVSDTGPGLDPEEMARMFEPYWSARRYASRGSGLGLFITRSIIEAHGGRIWAAATPDSGSTFHFTLPIAAPAA